MAGSEINLRVPSKYSSTKKTPTAPGTDAATAPPAFTDPSIDWLARTWTVTHSTLSMWRSARNVRITYTPLPPSPPSGAGARARIDDLVQYEKASGKGGLKKVEGVDTAAAADGTTGAWDWRGKGWLGFVHSHWEILGWGERAVEGGTGDGEVERWAVTWFAPTLFTKEGVDLYSDRREGMSSTLAGDILAKLKGLEAGDVVKMVEADMRDVQIQLPWKEK